MPLERAFWTDTHCHLADEAFAGDCRDAIERARAAAVDRIVVVGDTVAASRGALDLAVAHAGLFAAVGLHPHNAATWSRDARDALVRLCDEGADKVVALGEMGLDFHYDHSPRDCQIEVFLEQAALARALGKPMILHCRAAYDLFIGLIREHRLHEIGGVVHCYGGSVEQARELADMGFFLGITGVVSFKKADTLRAVVHAVPIDRLVIETDAPYLAPVPHRGKRNEPAWVACVAECLARELDMPLFELSVRLRENTNRLFRLHDETAVA